MGKTTDVIYIIYLIFCFIHIFLNNSYKDKEDGIFDLKTVTNLLISQ